MALKGHLASVKVQSSAVAMTAEATSTSDSISYQITDSAKRILDLNTSITVYDSAVETTENYSIDYLNGTITFDSSASRTITIDAAYVTLATVATATAFNFSGTADALDNTAFLDTIRSFQSGLRSGTATLTRFFVVDDIFIDTILDGSIKVIEYYVDDTQKISFYGLLTSDSIDSPVEGLITESLSYQITNQIEVN